MIQTSLDFTGSELRDKGIQKAIDNANTKLTDWSERAYTMFVLFVRYGDGQPFQIEDFRKYAAQCGLETPPNLRAFGHIPIRAVKDGLIRCIGTAKVDNPNAHRANAALWQRVK